MRLCSVVAFGTALAMMALPVAASTVDMTFIRRGEGQQVRVSVEGVSFNTFAGQLVHMLSHGTGALEGMDGHQTTFCLDIMQSVSYGEVEFTIAEVGEAPLGRPMGAEKAAAISDLYINAAGQQFLDDSSIEARDFATAFQIAIWEVVSDYNGTRSSLDHRFGNLKVTQTDGTQLSASVRGYLNTLFDAVGRQSGQANILALLSGEAQDQIIVVPVPAALLLGGLGVGLVAIRRRLVTRS